MHDGAPCRRSANTRRFLEVKTVRIFSWFARSPDLNPIENLWSDLIRGVRNRRDQPRKFRQLGNTLLQEWA